MKSQIAQDMARHLQQQIGDVLQRNCAAATMVMDPAEMMIILIEAAVSTSLTVAATVAANCDPADRAELFDHTVRMIHASILSDRSRSLAAVDQQRTSGR